MKTQVSLQGSLHSSCERGTAGGSFRERRMALAEEHFLERSRVVDSGAGVGGGERRGQDQ